MASNTGTFANLHFTVAPTAGNGTFALTPTGLTNDPPLSFDHLPGSLAVTSVGPTANGSFVLETTPGEPMSVRFVFSTDVSESLTENDLTLTNLTTDQVIPAASISLFYDDLTNTATFSFPGFAGGVLPNGNYTAVLDADGVTNSSQVPMQDDASVDFFFLNGDANRDRKVDIDDLAVLTGNWQQPNMLFSQGDFNYDGIINDLDLGILSLNWQATLPEDLGSPSSPAIGTTTPLAPSPILVARRPTTLSPTMLTLQQTNSSLSLQPVKRKPAS
jgi:hypothetical protein